MTIADVQAQAQRTMQGVILPGNSTVAFREQPVPTPGHGQVLVRRHNEQRSSRPGVRLQPAPG